MADYRLTAGDIATFPTLIRIQNDIGPGTSPLTQPGVWDFMVQLDALAKQYSAIQNAQLRGWVDGIFTPLITTTTVYQCSVLELYVAATWGRWLSTYCANRGSAVLVYPTDFWTFLLKPDVGWPWPRMPSYWFDALNSLYWGWFYNNEPPQPQAIFWKGPGTTCAQQETYQQALFDPSQWTDVRVASQIVGNVTAAQSAAVHDLLKDGALTPDSALFLPWLLNFMVMFSGAADQRLVAKILEASAPSTEYPNDIFANQLVYLMLMTLADPNGTFGWPNATLQSTVQNLIALIQHGDPASVALKQSLANHLKLLVSDASYPMQDPYNPSIGFTTRQTDTLAALNRAWAPSSH